MSRAVFLDRDGVLNETAVRQGVPRPPAGLNELIVLPGVREACQTLSAAGFKLICITNQPDLARGTQRRETVDAINARLTECLGLDAVLVCPHDDDDGCECRKPKAGMLLEAAQEMDLNLSQSVTVGDRWRDIAAGRAAGTKCVFVDRGYTERAPDAPDLTVEALKEAVGWIISQAR